MNCEPSSAFIGQFTKVIDALSPENNPLQPCTFVGCHLCLAGRNLALPRRCCAWPSSNQHMHPYPDQYMIGDGKDRCLIVGIFMYFHSSCDSHPNFHKYPQTKFSDPSLAKEIHFCGLCAEVGGERFAYRVGWDAVFVV